MSLLSNGDDNPTSTTNGGGEEVDAEPHFDPIIYLPEVHIHSNEEGETILIQLRAKLFRHCSAEKLWKERGTGEVKLLHNEETNAVRVVMRRDKTLKLCANHYVTTDMELKSNCGSDRAWVWSTQADVSDGEPHPEVLAIRFQNADAAKRFKDKFEEAKSIVASVVKVEEHDKDGDKDSAVSDNSDVEGSSSDDDVAKGVSKLNITSESKDQKDGKEETEDHGVGPNNS
uniref:Ran-specific GTPase-activating protein n=1 Tax=Lygus hesperus TaxID=30085 RepID=A0A0K8SP24_LYGHE